MYVCSNSEVTTIEEDQVTAMEPDTASSDSLHIMKQNKTIMFACSHDSRELTVCRFIQLQICLIRVL